MCAAAIKEKRKAAERFKREWEEKEKRRREAERRRTLEAKRWEFLECQMRLEEEAGRIDGFVKEYTSRYPNEDLPSSCRQLIQWARERSKSIRSAIAPDELAATLDHYRLMDDETEICSWIKFE